MNIYHDVDIFIQKQHNRGICNNLMRLSSFLMITSIFAFPDNITIAIISRAFFGICFVLFVLKVSSILNIKYFAWAFTFSCIGITNMLFAYNLSAAEHTFFIMLQAIWIGFMLGNWLKISCEYKCVFDSMICATLILCIRLFRYIDFSSWGSRKVGIMLGINVNSLGLRIAIAFVYSFLLANIIKRKPLKAFYVFCSLLFVVFILITGSRRALILVIIAIYVISVMLADNITRRLKVVLGFGCFLVVVYLLLTRVPQLYSVIGSRMESFLTALFSSGEVLDGGRDVMINRALELFSERPVFGWGMGNFRYVSGINHEYSHNTYVELLFATGVLGFASYYSIILVIIKKIRILKRKSISSVICIFMFLYIVISDMAAANYTSIASHLLIAIAVAIPESLDYYLSDN